MSEPTSTVPHRTYCLSNGLWLVVEPVANVRSAAFTLILPGGGASDPPERLGMANLLATLLPRGAGERDSRALSDALDELGLHHNESAEVQHSTVSGVGVARNVLDALPVISDLVRRPHLPDDQLEAGKALIGQELQAIEDDPGQKLVLELKARALPAPWGQPVLGTPESITAITNEELRDFHRRQYRPNGAVLGIAGAVDFDDVRQRVEACFGSWEPVDANLPEQRPFQSSRVHVRSEKTQTHLGLGFGSVSVRDDDYFEAHGAVSVLSGGMSSRLFTEVREKRGLCYSVGAQYVPLRDWGSILCYSSTMTERAAQTLEVVLAELHRLREGISEAEVDRVRVGLKSSLVMQEESTTSRSSAIARNWFYLGRVRTVAEVAKAIDALTPTSILGYLERHPPSDFTIVTLGPAPLAT